MQNCRKHTGGPKQHMENGAAQAKSEDHTILGASNTRLVHTSCIWGRQNCRKHTGGPKKNHGKWSSTSQKWRSKHTWSFPIQDWCILLAYGGGKIVENTLEDPNKTWKMEQHKPKVKITPYLELPIQDWCILLAYGGGKIVENKLEDPNKTWKNGAAQAKSEDQNIHGASNTRLVHTSCIWGRQNCRKHTGGPKKKHGKWSSTSQKCRSKHTWNFPIQEWCILFAYGGCKIVENTLEDPRKTMENGAAQAKSAVQNIHGASNIRLVHTSCIWGVTPSTPRLQQMRGIAAPILDGFGVFTHYDATQKWGFLECHHKQQDTLREWTPLGLHKCIVLCMPFFRNPLDWHIVASNGQINACMIFECIFRVAIYSVTIV